MKLGTTDLNVFELCLGGNVFGWTADQDTSFQVLDDYAAAGGNFIDTSDAYSHWIEGHQGGESEVILGNWMQSRGNRASMIIATKVGILPSRPGLSAANINLAVDECLTRLQTDRIDVLYAHRDDEQTPLEETRTAFDALVRSGKVGHIAASNYSAERLQAAQDIARSAGLATFVALQHHYNLVHRTDYEGPLRDVVAANNMVSLPYYSLASGFLTGKYRDGAPLEGARAKGAGQYMTDRGLAILAAMDDVAAEHEVSLTAVALAWLAAQPTVATPLASARIPAQLPDLLQMVGLELTAEQIATLSAVSS